MELTHHQIDLVAHRERNIPLTDVIERRNPDKWLVAFSPITFDKPIDFREVSRESLVAIPLFPYVVIDNPIHALGFAFQLGVSAIGQLSNPVPRVRRLHLSLGSPCEQLVDQYTQRTSWQFHLGFALLLD